MSWQGINTNFIWIHQKTVLTQSLAVGLLMRELWGDTALRIRLQTDTPKFPAAIYRITMYSHVKRYMYGEGLIDATPDGHGFTRLDAIVGLIAANVIIKYSISSCNPFPGISRSIASLAASAF